MEDRSWIAALFLVGLLLGMLIEMGCEVVSPLLPNDVHGRMKFRTSWAVPPTCTVHATTTELEYVCVEH